MSYVLMERRPQILTIAAFLVSWPELFFANSLVTLVISHYSQLLNQLTWNLV